MVFSEEIIEKGHRPNTKIVFNEDPKKIVEQVIEVVRKNKINEYKVE